MGITKSLVGLCAVLCLVSVGLMAPGANAAPAPRGGPMIAALQGPDLVIQEIIVREQSAAEFSQVRLSVRVRNRGNGAAGPSEVALIYSQNVLGAPNAALVLTKTTEAIAAGEHEELDFVIDGIAGSAGFRGMLVAVADAPVAAHPSGQVREGKPLMVVAGAGGPTDFNNGFVVIFDTAGRTLPLRFKNPAVN